MAQVAELLGESLRKRVVFIGASLLPLMETVEHVISASRATDDVDAVTATTSYSHKFAFEEALRARGFRNDMRQRAHADRWLAPGGGVFDCVSRGRHTGGTGSENDPWVIDHAVETDLPPLVRHATAVGLLRLKVAAYADRGAASPVASKDLSHIATILATRPVLPAEVRAMKNDVRVLIANRCHALLNNLRGIAAIRSHIASRQPLFDGVDELVLDRLREIASMRMVLDG